MATTEIPSLLKKTLREGYVRADKAGWSAFLKHLKERGLKGVRGHDLAHKGRHRIGVDDILDRVAPVVRISGFDGARGLKNQRLNPKSSQKSSHSRRDFA